MSIKEDNYRLLEGLKAGERLQIDDQGKLQKVSAVSKFFKEIFTGAAPNAEVQSIGVAYAIEKIDQDKTFRDLTKGGSAYSDLVKRLSTSLLLTFDQREKIALAWYQVRFENLVEVGYRKDVADAIVMQEMNMDSNISDHLKHFPERAGESASGSYFLKDRRGQKVGIFKPFDEEPYMPNNPEGLTAPFDPKNPNRRNRKGHIAGSAYLKEVAAYKLDVGKLAAVPETMFLFIPFRENATGTNVVKKRGSFQLFAKGRPLDKLGRDAIAQIPKETAQKLALFDLLGGNGDRSGGNLLFDPHIRKLTPIDHGLMFLDDYDWMMDRELTNEHLFCWMDWDVLKEAWTEECKDWIFNFPSDLLKELEISDGSRRACQLRLIYLQEGIRAGKTPQELAHFCARKRQFEGESQVPLDALVTRTKAELTSGKKYQDEALFFTTFRQNVRKAFEK